MHSHYIQWWRVPHFLFLTHVIYVIFRLQGLVYHLQLVYWFICLSSLFVHFRNGPEYFTRGTAQVCISFMRFLQPCFDSRNFLVRQRYYYNYYSTPWEIFPSVSADGFSLAFEWQQVPLSPQYFSQYSSRSKYGCILEASARPVFSKFLYQSFGNCDKNTNYY